MSLPEGGLAAILDALPDPILLVSLDGNILHLNSRARSRFGAPAAPDTPLISWLEDEATTVRNFLKTCARNRQPLPGSLTFRLEDGTGLRYSAYGARLQFDSLDAICLQLRERSKAEDSQRLHILNDSISRLRLEIRARKQAEGILEAEKQTLASVLRGDPLSQALNILAGAIEEHSDGLLVSLLLLEDGKILRHAAAPSLPDDYTRAIDGVEIGPAVGSCGTAAFKNQTVIAVDLMSDPRWSDYRELAGKADLRACWSTPILANAGDVLGTIALYYREPRAPTDDELKLIANAAFIAGSAIERHRAQTAMNEMLEREVTQRELAEKENRAKDEFLAMLGHELRNPLSAIANAAYALQAIPNETDKLAAFQQIAVRETAMLKRILDDLLDVTRLSQGKLRIQRSTVHADELIAEVVEAVHLNYPDRDIRLESDGEIGLIEGDATRIRQIVQNLLDNAIKYSEDGDQVSVRTRADGDDIVIEVADTGQGIEAEHLDSIFEPFYQSERSTARGSSGLGLGLALAKRFVAMHRGSLDAHSAGAGKGSTFTLKLPRGNPSEAESKGTSAAAARDAAPARVMVVEDNAGAREGLCQLLKAWGHEVVAAGDGQEAIRLFRDAHPDVALVDIGLPKVDGYEVARTFRGESDPGKVKLVALTGYGQRSDQRRAIEAGFDAHIVKPASIDDLVAVLGAPVK